ncbi:MAG: DNA repair protein RadC [Clostridia bacterium]|nr:DNA repair protein RadC [Clostridia bacterium]
MSNTNLHKNHRQRVRDRYFADGIKSMADHNIIEFLLFFGIPYKDTNDIAHELTERFGDLNGVLDAPAEELMKVNGIGENAAALIHLVHDISVTYNERKKLSKPFIATEDRFTSFLTMKYAGETREIVYMLFIDCHGRISRCVKVCDGSPESVTVDNRTIVEAAVRNDANEIIIAHNHPNGFAVPSTADVRATMDIIPLLKSINVHLIDHIIVAEDDCFSMAKSKKYAELFK